MTHRFQLSLFLPEESRSLVDGFRESLDPIQHHLIAAHVTLCREDELGAVDELYSRLIQMKFPPLKMCFGEVKSFDGHGILLSCLEGAEQFDVLRQLLLFPKVARSLSPHITLAHPRNAKATRNSMALALQLPTPIEIEFDRLTLIEQVDREVWRSLWSLPLAAVTSAIQPDNLRKDRNASYCKF